MSAAAILDGLHRRGVKLRAADEQPLACHLTCHLICFVCLAVVPIR